MADITMCKGAECPLKERCKRFTSKADEYRQAWFMEIPYADGKCDMYWGDKQLKQISINFNDEGREVTIIISPCDPDEWWSEQGYDVHYCEDYNQISVYKSDNNYITIHKQKINNYGESL